MIFVQDFFSICRRINGSISEVHIIFRKIGLRNSSNSSDRDSHPILSSHVRSTWTNNKQRNGPDWIYKDLLKHSPRLYNCKDGACSIFLFQYNDNHPYDKERQRSIQKNGSRKQPNGVHIFIS